MSTTSPRRYSGLDDYLLWRRWRTTNTSHAYAKLIERFRPAADSIAARRAGTLPAHVDIDDLTSAAYLGLMAALESFDPTRGAPLGAWIAARVSGAVVDELRRGSRLPRSVVDRQKRIAAAAGEMQHALGRPPTRAELAGHLDTTVDALREHEADMLRGMVTSLDAPAAGVDDAGDALCLGDLLMSGDRDGDPVWRMEAEETTAAIRRAVRTLDHQEMAIYRTVYQEGGCYGDVAQQLGVSASRVSQIAMRMRGKLRARLDTDQLAAA